MTKSDYYDSARDRKKRATHYTKVLSQRDRSLSAQIFPYTNSPALLPSEGSIELIVSSCRNSTAPGKYPKGKTTTDEKLVSPISQILFCKSKFLAQRECHLGSSEYSQN